MRTDAARALQGIEGVRFKRLIMDESATDRSPNPPEDASKKRVVFCTGKVLRRRGEGRVGLARLAAQFGSGARLGCRWARWRSRDNA